MVLVTRYIAIGLAAYGAAVSGLYMIQRQLLYFPYPGERAPDPAAFGADDMSPVRLLTADGLSLLAWYRPAADPGGPVIVYFHGNAGHIGFRVPKIRPYLEAGYGVLLVSYRGYGGNPGRPSEEGLYADGRAALAWLAEAGVAPGRIVLYGESLGGGVAVQMASETRVGAVVLEAPFSSVTDIAAARMPLVPVRWLLRDRFDCAAKIASIGAPLLVLHGERDGVVPVRFGRKLYAAAVEPKEALFIAEAGHNNLYDFGAAEAVRDFMARSLPRE